MRAFLHCQPMCPSCGLAMLFSEDSVECVLNTCSQKGVKYNRPSIELHRKMEFVAVGEPLVDDRFSK